MWSFLTDSWEAVPGKGEKQEGKKGETNENNNNSKRAGIHCSCPECHVLILAISGQFICVTTVTVQNSEGFAKAFTTGCCIDVGINQGCKRGDPELCPEWHLCSVVHWQWDFPCKGSGMESVGTLPAYLAALRKTWFSFKGSYWSGKGRRGGEYSKQQRREVQVSYLAHATVTPYSADGYDAGGPWVHNCSCEAPFRETWLPE